MPATLSVIQVDPSIYTGPYDAALTEGLRANDVQARWAMRRPRNGEAAQLPTETMEPVFRELPGGAKRGGPAAKLRSGLGYLAGWRRLLSMIGRTQPDVVHIQWPLLPLADAAAIHRARASTPVVITVHDLQPYNGAPTSRLQLLGFDAALRAADHLIVHTAAARDTLIERGFDPGRISAIPHGPLPLPVSPRRIVRAEDRWTFVLFGKLQAYKGAEVLIEAVGLMNAAVREGCRFIIAGEPLIPVQPLLARSAELGLERCIEFRLHHHSDEQMAELFEAADTFVFPYRQVEASGVLAMVSATGRWMVASDLGAFSEVLADGARGALVPPGDAVALAAALEQAVGRTPAPGLETTGPDWAEIGRRTREVYETAIAARRNGRPT
jgi:glycosyltransferase involved in cell wall biosynthesis